VKRQADRRVATISCPVSGFGTTPYRRDFLGLLVMTTQERSLVVKATSGLDSPERCAQAFTVAATAIAAGVRVSMWLTGEAAWFALPGRAAEFVLAESPPLTELLDAILAGGTLTLCTQCAARRDISPDDVIAGVRVAGAAVFVGEVTAPGAQALVY
jgi:predicted peroxiredoxin